MSKWIDRIDFEIDFNFAFEIETHISTLLSGLKIFLETKVAYLISWVNFKYELALG